MSMRRPCGVCRPVVLSVRCQYTRRLCRGARRQRPAGVLPARPRATRAPSISAPWPEVLSRRPICRGQRWAGGHLPVGPLPVPPPPTDTDTSAAVNINRLQGQSSKHGVRLRDPPPGRPHRPDALSDKIVRR